MAYKRCLNCGNFFEVDQSDESSNYCSNDCYKEYEVCLVCGNYFEKEEIVRTKKILCCKKCSEIL